LAGPGFIILDKYLERSNSNPDNIVAPPSPDVASNPGETTIPDVTASPENTDTKNWTAITPDEIDIVKECLPESHNFKWDVIKDGKKLDTYSRDNTVVFKPADKYNEIDGVTTFRGNNYRNSASFGSANVRKKNSRKFGVSKKIYRYMDRCWLERSAGNCKWSNELRKKMNLFQDKKDKNDLKEVIYATLDGKYIFSTLTTVPTPEIQLM